MIVISTWLLCSCGNQETYKSGTNSSINSSTGSQTDNCEASGSNESLTNGSTDDDSSSQSSIQTAGESTGSVEASSLQALAMNAYKAVLQNKSHFKSMDDKKDSFLKDLLSFGGSGFDAELEITHFAILDMDGDKMSEIVLELSVVGKKWPDFYEILHYENGTVYGYLRVYRKF